MTTLAISLHPQATTLVVPRADSSRQGMGGQGAADGGRGSAAVDIASMTDANHQNQEHPIFDLVEDAILTDPDAVAIFLAFELLDTHGPWRLCELIDGHPHP